MRPGPLGSPSTTAQGGIMAAVKMHIDKFGGEVTIDEDHPLAIAQRAKDSKKGAKAAGEKAAPKKAAPKKKG